MQQISTRSTRLFATAILAAALLAAAITSTAGAAVPKTGTWRGDGPGIRRARPKRARRRPARR
jgi:hypothetical protein